MNLKDLRALCDKPLLIPEGIAEHHLKRIGTIFYAVPKLLDLIEEMKSALKYAYDAGDNEVYDFHGSDVEQRITGALQSLERYERGE